MPTSPAWGDPGGFTPPGGTAVKAVPEEGLSSSDPLVERTGSARSPAEEFAADPTERSTVEPTPDSASEELARRQERTEEMAPVARPQVDAFIGTELGRFRILAQLSEGGMGVIYRGEDVASERPVAVKVLRRELAVYGDIVRRFFTEARIVGEIRHPGIVEIVDFIENWALDPPLLVLVTELLEGEDIAMRVRRVGCLHPAEVVAVGAQIAAALDAAHSAGVLHRDLKPSNVFLCSQGPCAGRAKLLDFGLAKVVDGGDPDARTDPSVSIGTPEYMAPEQLLARTADARTDVYALGLVLYEMLTARRAFSGGAVGDVMVRQVQEQPRPIGQLRWLPCPRALERVVTRCLEKRPDDRYQSAAALQAALEQCWPEARDVALDDDPVLHAVVGRQDGEAPARAAVAAASAAAPSIRLAIALGKALLRELELSRDLIRIGSDARQDVRLVDPEIAPQHCCIRQLRGELFLADLGAPAGTLVNGRRARVERLRPGDAIAVGPFTILFQPDAPQLAVLTRARKK